MVRSPENVRCSKNRICLLKEHLSAGVAAKEVLKWILRSRARHALCMEKAPIFDDLNEEEGRLGFLDDCAQQQMLKVKEFLLKFDFIRFSVYVGDIQAKKTLLQTNKWLDFIARLKHSRYPTSIAQLHMWQIYHHTNSLPQKLTLRW